jgi:hypothetical protein
MARYDCERCGVVCNTTNPPHLCKDIAARLRRRERQVEAIVPLVEQAQDTYYDGNARQWAETIVARLANLQVTED